MPRAVFLDYTGTITQEGGADLEEMAGRLVRGSTAGDVKTLMDWWLANLERQEEASWKESFISEEDIIMVLLHQMEKEFRLKENLAEIQQLNKNYWMYAPIFSDVRPFLAQCPLPVYIITNNSEQYVRVCLKRNELHVNGIICGDSVRAYKPRREIFLQALRVSGTAPQDALMVGDTVASDVLGAQAAGMDAILLDRRRRNEDERIRKVSSLMDLLRILK